MPEAEAEFRLSPEAERDMQGIWTYTYEQWGLEKANHYTDELIAGFAELAAYPQRGRRVDQIRSGYRCSRIGRYAIYYRAMEYGIAVVRVLHDRMLPIRHLPGPKGI